VVRELVMYWVEGGWGMWLMLPSLVLTLAIVVERVRYFARESVDEEAFLGVVAALVREGRVADAVTWSLRAHNAVGRMLVAGLARLDAGDGEALAAMELVALREQPRVEGETRFLAPAAQVAALFGFFGTITGMCLPFHCDCYWRNPADYAECRARLLACAIAEALHCTHFGLAVGALAMAAGFALRGPTARCLARLDAAAALVVVLTQERRVPRRLGPAYR
jgi:biopolymer transport protein ExbB